MPGDEIELRQAAASGNSDAQFCLGQRHLSHFNEGAAQDAEALNWLRLSAGQGNARAEARLGLVYYTGRLVPQDFAEAAKWYRMAADAGDRDGELRLARMYREGKGVPVDLEEARKWAEAASHAAPPAACARAAPAGAAAAAPAVAAGLAPAAAIVSSGGGGALPQYPELRRAAENGDAASQFQLGSRYYDERKRDPVKDAEAQKWFLLAAAQGYALAEDRLGSLYYWGRGVPQDYVQAAKWYRRAAEHGNVDAMTRLGGMYRDGRGVPRDHEEYHKWTNRGSDLGTRSARHRDWIWFAGLLLGALAFAASLRTLQRHRLAGRERLALATFVHGVGIALVLNSLITFGLPELLFPKCGYNFLAASCSYQNKTIQSIATSLRNWQMFDLIWTFMGGIGLIFHALALWYLIYVFRPLWRRSRGVPA